MTVRSNGRQRGALSEATADGEGGEGEGGESEGGEGS